MEILVCNTEGTVLLTFTGKAAKDAHELFVSEPSSFKPTIIKYDKKEKGGFKVLQNMKLPVFLISNGRIDINFFKDYLITVL